MITLVPTKPADVARRDRDIGGVAAFVLFGAFIVGLVVAVRRFKKRALQDRADRELRDEIEGLGAQRRGPRFFGGVGGGAPDHEEGLR